VIPPLTRFASNPIVRPEDIPFARATGAFNPGAAICHLTGRVALLVRVWDADRSLSLLALAISSDGEHIDEIRPQPAIAPAESYEQLGVEDCRITYLAAEGRYAITYTGYSATGPRVCLITTDDILDPARYRRHGPRIEGDNKNSVLFPETVGGRYLFLHRPMPRAVLAEVARLEDPWPSGGTPVLAPVAGSWRSSRVGAGAPPLRTRAGWLVAFHGATAISEGNVYSMGWCLLDLDDPTRVRHVSPEPALAPEAPYEIVRHPIPQVDMNNFEDGVRVVFPEGLVDLGGRLLLYYGAGDTYVAGAEVARAALEDALAGVL
jgi:beta-1,2-mannobiose phosphorylase / 1,2-beta-oligomannan phosphorylase